MRNQSKGERDSNWDDDVSETLIEVTSLQARQAFEALDIPNLREQVEDEHQEAVEGAMAVHQANAARLAELNMVTTTVTIEIAPTDTGRSKCIACWLIQRCLACVSLSTKATFSSR